MSIPDPIAEIVALLAGDAAVAALAGTRVLGGSLTDAVREEMPAAAVVVKAAGGPGRRGFEKVRRTRIDTICYGANLEQSDELHRAVREMLETLRPTGSIRSAIVSSDGNGAVDPTTQWPTTFASYLVLSATRS
jgi:hypothetical protein